MYGGGSILDCSVNPDIHVDAAICHARKTNSYMCVLSVPFPVYLASSSFPYQCRVELSL